MHLHTHCTSNSHSHCICQSRSMHLHTQCTSNSHSHCICQSRSMHLHTHCTSNSHSHCICQSLSMHLHTHCTSTSHCICQSLSMHLHTMSERKSTYTGTAGGNTIPRRTCWTICPILQINAGLLHVCPRESPLTLAPQEGNQSLGEHAGLYVRSSKLMLDYYVRESESTMCLTVHNFK